MFGQVAAALALILVFQGAVSWQQKGWSAVVPEHIDLINTKRLLVIAAVLITIATVILVFILEFGDDLDNDLSTRLSTLYVYLPRAGWVLGTLGLFLVANGLRRRS
jgi:uncharacterized membrane protein